MFLLVVYSVMVCMSKLLQYFRMFPVEFSDWCLDLDIVFGVRWWALKFCCVCEFSMFSFIARRGTVARSFYYYGTLCVSTHKQTSKFESIKTTTDNINNT